MTAEFEGRTAIVTGGASGMGEAIAHELASRGAQVAVLDICEERARVAVSALPRGAGPHLAVVADVASADEVDRAVEAVIGRFGSIDLLCNAAGIPDDATPCHEMSLEQWNRLLAVDLTGPFL